MVAKVRRNLSEQDECRSAAKRVCHGLLSDDTATSTIKEPGTAGNPHAVQGLVSNREASTPLPMQLLLPKTGLTFAMCSCDIDAVEVDLLSPSSSLESSDFLFFNLCTSATSQPLAPASAECAQQQSMLHAPSSRYCNNACSDYSAQTQQHTALSIGPLAPPQLKPSFARQPTSSSEKTGLATAKAFGTSSPAAFPSSPIQAGSVTKQPPAAPRRRLPQQRFVAPCQLGTASSLGTLATHTQADDCLPVQSAPSGYAASSLGKLPPHSTKALAQGQVAPASFTSAGQSLNTATQADNRLSIQSIPSGYTASSFCVGLLGHTHTQADHTQSQPSGSDAPSLPLESSSGKKKNGISSPRIRSAPFGAVAVMSAAPDATYQEKSSKQSIVSRRPDSKADQSDKGSLRQSPAPLEPLGQNSLSSSPGTKSVPAPRLLQSLLEFEEAQQSRVKALQLQASRYSLAAELHLEGRRPVPLASTAGLLHRLALERSS